MIERIIKDSIQLKELLLKDTKIHNTILSVVDIICESFKNNKKVIFCGNGGSAADAQHLSSELSGKFYKDRKALPAEALHCNTSYLTAVANDYNYDSIYSRLVDGIMIKGDILIGISTSGNSKNIVKAFEIAKEKEITTISLTGNSGYLISLSDYNISVPSNDTPRIQECHILLGHIICEFVESNLFK